MKKRIALFLCTLMLSSLTVSTAFAKEKNNDDIYKGVTSYVNEVYVNLNTKEKDKLVDELYKEKSSSKNIDNSSITKSNTLSKQAKEIDESYERVQKEEKYIVNLINSLGENTSISNWKFNYNYLKNNYDVIKKMKNININYINSYIEAYKFVLLNESMPDEKVNTRTSLNLSTSSTSSAAVAYSIASTSGYNSGLAIDYATRYFKNYNPNYSNWSSAGGDCANFVSQCLYAGGKKMKGTPGSSSSAANFSNWFSSGTAQSTSNVSATWRGADAFRNYWQVNSSSYKKFTKVDTNSWNYGYTGDAVSLLDSNGRAYHTMIIVGYSNPDFILAAHSASTATTPLSSKSPSGGFIIYNMR